MRALAMGDRMVEIEAALARVQAQVAMATPQPADGPAAAAVMSKAVTLVTENAGLVDYEPKKGRMRILAAQAEARCAARPRITRG
jgi:tripartite-type tricarboxylate transporter receptor subunit TctC